MSVTESEILLRRKRIAEEIGGALADLGLSRKAFACMMGRQPSEVTRWLSGRHNFTSDLLEEMSIVLGRPISGSDDSVYPAGAVVDGYCHVSDSAASLNEPSSYAIKWIDLPEPTVTGLSRMAKSKGMTLREYVRDVLGKAAETKAPSAADFCGIWGEGYPDADEIRSYRTRNTFPEL